MSKTLLYPIGCTPACNYAAAQLARCGVPLADHPSPEVTHLLLDVPSFSGPGKLRCGLPLMSVLETLPETITIIGGRLDDEALSQYCCIDLLKDDTYLAENAAITAECALMLAAQRLPATLKDTPTLILGWGRIGKILMTLLAGLGNRPFVYARKRADRAMIRALGSTPVSAEELPVIQNQMRLILNTVPEIMIKKEESEKIRNCVKLDLASSPGILGSDVIRAGGLPGKYAPETSGKLIAATVLRLTKEDAK